MNVIDSLVVALELNAEPFDKERRRASDVWKQTRDEVVKHGKDIEKAGQYNADAFRSMTRALATFLAKIASAAALTQFLSSLNQVNAATGRVAQTLEMSPQALSAFEMAVERAGGTAEGAATSLRNLRQVYNDLVTTGNSSALQPLAQLQALGGNRLNLQKPLTDQLGSVAENLKNVSKLYGASRAFDLARRIGIDEGTARLLMQGRAGVADALNATKGLAATKEQTEASIKLQKAWVELTQTLEAAGRELLERLTPSLLALIDTLKKLAGLLHDKVVTDILDAMKMIGDAFSDFGADIKRLISGLIMWADEKWFSMTGSHMLNEETRKSMAADGVGSSYDAAAARMKRMGSGGREAGVGGGGSAKASTRAEMMNYAMDQLRKEGVPESNLRAAAANLVGQADMESGLRPGLSHDQGTGYGIYGARLGRRAAMFNWLAANGYAKDSAEGQMRYMAHEAMSGRYPRTRSALMSGAYGVGVTNSITSEFESPAVVNARHGAVMQAFGAIGAPSMLRNRVGAAAAANINNSRNSSVVNNSSAQTSIGAVNVHTQATDGHGIARDLQNAITNHSFAAHLNYGAL